MPGRRTNTGDCFWLLGSLRNLCRIPFDAARVTSQFPPPYTLATFHEAARALVFKTSSQAPETLSFADAPTRLEPELIIFSQPTFAVVQGGKPLAPTC